MMNYAIPMGTETTARDGVAAPALVGSTVGICTPRKVVPPTMAMFSRTCLDGGGAAMLG